MANKTGTVGDDTLTGAGGNDRLDGAEGNDSLVGNAGNDSLIGGAGNDIMTGGINDDTYYVEDVGDKVVEKAGEGKDKVFSLVANYTLGANIENLALSLGAINGTGNALGNEITGNGDKNKLDGGAGNDTISGGWGDDTLIGGTGNDSLSGETLDDSLVGGAGNDTLAGGAGADTLVGGAGNDTYIVDADDKITEAAKGGIDTVVVNVAEYTLLDNFENLHTDFTAGSHLIGNKLNNKIVGNVGNDALDGGNGNDTLEGGTGANTLTGGAGNDTYILLSTATNTIVEADDGGIDEVQTDGNLNLYDAGFENIENLRLSGYSDGAGNSRNNVITGSENNNQLFGLDGKDTLYGGGGLDLLDGGVGKDVLIGGTGDDIYVVDDIGDKIIEKANEGRDGVVVNGLTNYTLAANFEDLTLGADAVNGTGNGVGNTITGNFLTNTLKGVAGNDTLDGGTGIDTLIGGTGNDTYMLGAAPEDVIKEAAKGGVDTIKANSPSISPHFKMWKMSSCRVPLPSTLPVMPWLTAWSAMPRQMS